MTNETLVANGTLGGEQPYFYDYSILFVISGTLACIEFFIGTPLNFISLIYFASSSSTISSSQFQYICICFTDLILTILSSFVALSCIAYGRAMLFGVSVLCNFWGVTWYALTRLSVFLITMLSISRVIALVYPLHYIQRRYLAIPTFTYLVVVIVEATFPMWFGAQYEFFESNPPSQTYCIWYYDKLPASRNVALAHFVCSNYIQFLLPLLPISVSCFASCVILSRRRMVRSVGTAGQPRKLFHRARQEKKASRGLSRSSTAPHTDDEEVGGRGEGGGSGPDLKVLSTTTVTGRCTSRHNKRYATITIIIMTIQYVIFHLPYWVVLSCDLATALTNSSGNICFTISGVMSPEEVWIQFSIIYIHTVVLNSTANAILYMFRIQRIRTYTRNALVRVFNAVVNFLHLGRAKSIQDVEFVYCTTRIPSTRTPILNASRLGTPGSLTKERSPTGAHDERCHGNADTVV